MSEGNPGTGTYFPFGFHKGLHGIITGNGANWDFITYTYRTYQTFGKRINLEMKKFTQSAQKKFLLILKGWARIGTVPVIYL